MPIPGIPPAATPPPVPVLPPKTPRPIERISVTWIAPDGNEYPLTLRAHHTRLQATSSLSAAVPVEVVTDPSPRAGVTVRHIRRQPRYLLLPILVSGRTHQEFIDRWRQLGDAFAQTDRDHLGRLRVRRPDGSTRVIDALYLSGWEGIPEQGWDWDIASVALLAPNPWWRAEAATVISRGFAEPADFFDPGFTISSGTVLGETTIVNPGEGKAWPTWTLTGPLDSLVATNHRTGETFTLDPDWDGGGPLGVGETVTIQTDPVRIRGPEGEVWTGAVSGTLWGLDRGQSDVEFAAAGADEGTTVTLSFHPLYQTA